MIVGQQDSMSLTSAGTRKRRVEPKWREKERAVFIAALACGSQRSGDSFEVVGTLRLSGSGGLRGSWVST